MSAKKNTKAVKTIEETYQMKSDIDHIIDLPDTYIGSIELTQADMWTLDETDQKMTFKSVQYIPGLYKIFDEVLVNAIDQYTRTQNDDNYVNKVTKIKVNIDPETNMISVMNDGEGIPVVVHQDYNMYIPELLLGNLRSSSNYDKDEKKITGGKNGLGSKLCGLFSTYMRIETVDSVRKLKYIQEFRNNLKEKGQASISKFTGKPYTKIDFSPDLQRFNLQKMNEGTVQLMKKRVIDTTACTGKTLTVFLNENKIECKTLDKYVNYYLEDSVEKVYDEGNERWEVVVAVNPELKFDQMSFVNGICTVKGGRHVDNVVNSITKEIKDIAASKGVKRKKMDIKQADLKNNMFIFIRSIVENPSFDSQIKECLITPATKFGSKYDPSEKFIEKLMKTSLIDRAMKLSNYKDSLELQKSSAGKKTSRLTGIDKLDDANKAGTDESLKCTLILTEGDSAKALAVAGLSVIGRDYFGVFPLKGKLMNVRGKNDVSVSKNEEINNLVKILGLKYHSKKVSKEETLQNMRYGRIMLFTDSDYDGSHIKGLVINLFAYFWPELLQIDGFIISLATPIIKVKKNKEVRQFYTLTEYEQWKQTMTNIKNWDVKYYKGLGTSTAEEAKEYFNNFEMVKIDYVLADVEPQSPPTDGTNVQINTEEDQYTNQCTESFNSLELAFVEDRKDDRKTWLGTYDRSEIIEQTQKRVKYSDFIHRDLKHFSNYDCERSIASMCDGLKPSLRKILYTCLKRNLKKEIKVSQLGGSVSEMTDYHHGESSLYGGIIGMAQDFVGSNNIELLVPAGQFGSRLIGGTDAASPRYIFTRLDDVTQLIFNPLDDPLLKYNETDGVKVEPEYYVPIIPMVLVNGTSGIGTGYSSEIPPHDPRVIIRNLINLMDRNELEEMKPWFRGFDGEVVAKEDSDAYINKGIYEVINDTTIRITELPIGRWTSPYKTFLETMMNDKDDKGKPRKYVISNIKNDSTTRKVDMTIQFKKGVLQELLKNNNIEKELKLTDSSYTNYSNMHLYNSRGVITKYDSVDEILREFYLIRLAYYVKRKEYLLRVLRRELDIYAAKVKFIEEFISGDIDIMQKEDEEIEEQLVSRGYPKFGSNESGDEDESNMSYQYLLSMQIRSLTKKKIEELKRLHENKLAEVNDLESKSEKDLWKIDLNKLLEKYDEKMRLFEENILESTEKDKKNNSKNGTKKAPVRRTVAKKMKTV